jgi:HK97 gp10 family phage protein
MTGFTVQFEGLKELDDKLKQLSDKAARKVIRAGLMEGGKVFQAAVIERAPERPDLPSGDALPVGALKLDIELHFGRDPEGLPAAIVTPGDHTAHVADWVEYGHRMVTGGYSKETRPGSGKYRGSGMQLKNDEGELVNVPAHPFIRPAYEGSQAEATDVAIRKIARGIEEAAAKK